MNEALPWSAVSRRGRRRGAPPPSEGELCWRRGEYGIREHLRYTGAAGDVGAILQSRGMSSGEGTCDPSVPTAFALPPKAVARPTFAHDVTPHSKVAPRLWTIERITSESAVSHRSFNPHPLIIFSP